MKKALLTLGIALAAMTTQAQDFRVGITGGLNSTWLLNNNVFDANDELDVASTFGGRFGIEGIYAFNEKLGVSVGLNFLSKHNQKFNGKDLPGDSSFNAIAKLSYFDIPILFRLTSSGGSYFEIGPQIGLLGKNSFDFDKSDKNGKASVLNYSGKSFDGSYNKTNVALVFGFGADIDITDNIYITTGLRLGYSFSDVTKEYDTDNELATATNNNDVSPLNTWAHYEDAQTTGSSSNPNNFNYQKTNRAFAGLNLGVSYKFTK
ncbi:MAG: porin family protein, partial [Bacteroidota bacterium]